jgi:ubiquitin-activating enzyme E1
MCTLKNFPYLIEHCIQWGRDYFEGLFASTSEKLVKFLSDPETYIQSNLKSMLA